IGLTLFPTITVGVAGVKLDRMQATTPYTELGVFDSDLIRTLESQTCSPRFPMGGFGPLDPKETSLRASMTPAPHLTPAEQRRMRDLQQMVFGLIPDESGTEIPQPSSDHPFTLDDLIRGQHETRQRRLR